MLLLVGFEVKDYYVLVSPFLMQKYKYWENESG